MGDHRASIKITMDAHGKTYKQEWWINWSPDSTGCDPRVMEWFEECWRDAYRRFDAAQTLANAKENQEKQEKNERETLARLKAKYE